MPYQIKKEKSGFFVYDPKTRHKFSKKGLPKIMAEKQRTAIILSQHRGEKNLGKYYM
jgi:hypothetical protein